MMALRCDNCGRYFDFDKSDDINTIAYGHLYPNGNIDYSVYKDLCPACMAAIMKALEDRKEAFIAHESTEM